MGELIGYALVLGEYALRFVLYLAAMYFCIAVPQALKRIARSGERQADALVTMDKEVNKAIKDMGIR
jgi:hypothetical protein